MSQTSDSKVNNTATLLLMAWLVLAVGSEAALAQGPSKTKIKGDEAKSAKQPVATPVIPGLPELPAGIELPEDVKAFLKKGLEEAAKQKPAPAKGPTTAKTPAAKKATTAVVHSVAAATTFQRAVTEKSLGSIGELDLSKRDNNKPSFWVSPDGRRFAYLIEKKGIVIDGKEHLYLHMYQGGVKEGTFRFSPDSRHTAWVAYIDKQGETLVINGVPEKRGWNFIDGKGPEFSQDSQHIAYIARRYAGGDVEYALMIDGKEREVFKKSPAWSLSFTADGRRVVWGEEVGERTLMRETSVDGSEPRIERTHGPSLMTINFFFGGGGQMGYVANEGPEKHFVFYDGKDDSLRFKELHHRDVRVSADGKHVAYVAEPDSFRRVVVVDGKQSKVYGGLDADYVKDSLTLSPDGRRWAYAIKKRNDYFAVIDGKEGKAYRPVDGLVFSGDGKRVAYRAVLGNKLLIVVDGKEGPGYDELGLPAFSPDGKTVVCGAGAGKRKFIVVNGQNQKAYGELGEPEFSPDGKRLVYEAEIESGGQSILVDSGREGKLYDDIKDRRYFSEDGGRLAMVVFDSGQQMVVVDGVEGNRYDTVITLGGGQVRFDSADRFHYLATKGGELFLVEETIQR